MSATALKISHSPWEIENIEIIKEIGRGASSIIYSAKHQSKIYALKVLQDKDNVYSPERKQAFFREASILARITHTNLVQIYKVSSPEEEPPYIVMEFVENSSLAELLANGKLGEEHALSLLRQLADGLCAVHRYGLVHRDLKPQNIMLTADGKVKIIDFGLAINGTSAVAGEQAVGTFLYSSPEQTGMLNREVDFRSDLYSLGIILFEILTGDVPFRSQDQAELLQLHLKQPPPNLRESFPEISQVTQFIVEKLLEKDPDQRYQSGQSLLHDLNNFEKLARELESQKKISLGLFGAGIQKGSDLPLAGRKTEQAQLDQVLKQVFTGKGHVVVICGDPGSGKSRLARELLYKAELSGKPQVLFSKASMSGGVPFGPIRMAIDTYLASVFSLPGEEQEKIKQRIVGSLGEGAHLLKTFSKNLGILLATAKESSHVASQEKFDTTVAELLINIATENEPLIFLIDDIQWLDDSSLNVLKIMSANIKKSRVLILASMRQNIENPIDVPSLFGSEAEKYLSVLSLDLFDKNSTQEMVSDYLGKAAVDDRAVEQIFRRSGGNPFAIQQFLIALLDAGSLMIHWGTWIFLERGISAIDLSLDVTQLLLARTKNLSNRAKFILEHAALIDDEFSTDILRSISGIHGDEIRNGLSEALGAHLIESTKEGYHRFLHDRIREAFLSVWTPETLPLAHQKIAEYIESVYLKDTSAVFALARHYGLGTYKRNPNRMFEVNFKAAQTAFGTYAVKEAISYFEVASSALAVDPNLSSPDFEEQFSECYFRLGRVNEAFPHLERAFELSKKNIQKARIFSKLSLLYMTKGDKDKAWETLNLCFAQLGERPLEKNIFVAVSAIFNWAFSVFIDKFLKIRNPPKNIEEKERLKVLVEASARSIHMAFYDLRTDLALLSTFRSSLWARKLGISKELVLSYVNFGLLGASFHLPKTQKKYFELALVFAKQLEDPALLAHAQIQRANGLKFSGQDLVAEKNFREVLVSAARWSDPEQATSGYSAFCQILLRKGFYKEALLWAEKGRAVSDAAALKIEFESYRCGIYAALGRYHEAQQELERVESYLEKFGGKSTKALHMFNRGIYLLERGDLGAETEDFLNRYEESKIFTKTAPPYARSLLVPCGYIRINQWIKEPTAERRLKVIASIENLRKFGCSGSIRGALEPVLQAHISAMEGRIAVYEDRIGEAKNHFDLAERLSIQTDCHLSLFYVHHGRALIFYKQGHIKAADQSHRSAQNLAEFQGWAFKTEELRKEFPALQDSAERTGRSSHTVTVQASATESVQQLKLQKQLDALLELGTATSKIFGLEAHCHLVMKQISKLFNAERVFLFLFEKGSDRISMRLGTDHEGKIIDDKDIFRYSTTVVEKVRMTKIPLVRTSSDSGEEFNSQSVVAYNLRSVMVVPLLLQGDLIGVIYLDSRVAKGIFNENDVQLLTTFGSHIAIALENAKSSQLEIQKRTLEKDIEVVGAVQSLLLPKINRISTKNLDACTYFTPAQQAGGDWWWATQKENDILRIIVADVTGHGAGSAMVTALLAGGYQTANRLLKDAPTEELLKSLNEMIYNSCGQEYWMTFTVLEFDPKNRKVETWYMGSPEIYLANQTTSKLTGARNSSTPLGSELFHFDKVVEDFNPGDQLIVFTDGLYEFKGKNNSDFDVRHLKRLIDKTKKIENIEEQVRQIVALREEASGSKVLEDDITFSIIRFKSDETNG